MRPKMGGYHDISVSVLLVQKDDQDPDEKLDVSELPDDGIFEEDEKNPE